MLPAIRPWPWVPPKPDATTAKVTVGSFSPTPKPSSTPAAPTRAIAVGPVMPRILAGAATALVMNLSRNPFATLEIAFWLLGSLEDRSFRHVALALPFIVAGGALLWLQCTGMVVAISLGHEVTRTNILYNTRGIWSVVLVWVVGHWFGNVERSAGPAVMTRRLLGAAILLGAVFLVRK